MNIETSKIELVKMILNINNPESIEELKNFLSAKSNDFWDDLTLSEKNEIQKGISELDRGERILYTDFLKKIS
ncbi:MAG: hypothetical protein DRI89_07535 [Bacteroidetes bacterium]|nr:MAG: hypothetical protein DRI89_07535 [Bacteroidota bacterium]